MSTQFHCQECRQAVESLPTHAEYNGQEIFLFDPVVCKPCLLELCEQYSTVCVNCGGTIPPYSQVGALKAGGGEMQLVHMTNACSTVGSAFHGYWGKGQLRNLIQIEAC
jgi:hypothetical protein